MESINKQTGPASPDDGSVAEIAGLDRNVSELYSLLDALLQQCTGPGGNTKAPTRSLYREARAALPPGYQMSIARRPAPVRKVLPR